MCQVLIPSPVTLVLLTYNHLKRSLSMKWNGYPESEATWENSDVVEDLQALDEFEELCKAEDSVRTTKINMEYIKDKWNKNHVSKYICSIAPPAELSINVSEFASKLKKY